MRGDFVILALAFAGGYAASIWTWPWVKSAILGIENEAASLKAEIAKLKSQASSAASSIRAKLP
jgi:hypothetical protein